MNNFHVASGGLDFGASGKHDSGAVGNLVGADGLDFRAAGELE